MRFNNFNAAAVATDGANNVGHLCMNGLFVVCLSESSSTMTGSRLVSFFITCLKNGRKRFV